jgi:hypothetical protein
MRDKGLIILSMLALWAKMPPSAKRAARITGAILGTTVASLLISWGLVAFTKWEASPGNWSEGARFAAAFIWVICQVIGWGIAAVREVHK